MDSKPHSLVFLKAVRSVLFFGGWGSGGCGVSRHGNISDTTRPLPTKLRVPSSLHQFRAQCHERGAPNS
eukprot:6216102-Amphidinium_carterae.1